jgi:hypothetical protein
MLTSASEVALISDPSEEMVIGENERRACPPARLIEPEARISG